MLHGSKSYVLQDERGQIRETHSIAAGLDYPGVGPELSYLRDCGRVQFVSATDSEAIEAIKFLAEVEGIIPALESAHARCGGHAPRASFSQTPDRHHRSLRKGR